MGELDTVTDPQAAHFTTFGGAVQQPTTLEQDPGPNGQGVMQLLKDKTLAKPAARVEGICSSKFATKLTLVDGSKPYQLLPQDMRRKTALIKCAAGQQFTQTIANPGAGNNIPATVLAGGRSFTVQSIVLTYTSSATVATRLFVLGVGNQFFAASGTQVASLTGAYTFAPGAPASASSAGANEYVSTPIPGTVFPAGTTLSSVVTNLQAGDTITGITVTYTVPSGAVVLGAEPMVDPNSPAGFPLNPGDANIIYTSGSPLFAIGTLGVGTFVAVNTLVEMYDGVAAVN